MPFYADTGTGNSDLTWQVAGGTTYAAEWVYVVKTLNLRPHDLTQPM
jgi:hypothetical protein